MEQLYVDFNNCFFYAPIKDYSKIQKSINEELKDSINIKEEQDKTHKTIKYTKVLKILDTEKIDKKIKSIISHLKENNELDAILHIATRYSRHRDIIELEELLFDYYKNRPDTPFLEKKEDRKIEIHLVEKR